MKGKLILGVAAAFVLALSGCQSAQVVATSGSQQMPSAGVAVSVPLPCSKTVSRYGSDPECDVKQEVKEALLDFAVEFTRRFLLSLIDRELNGNKGPRVSNDKLLYRSMLSAGVDVTSRRFSEPRFDEPRLDSHRPGESHFGEDRSRTRR